jgi:hypothetical protein
LSPFTVHRSPFTVHRSPFTVHRSPFTVRRSPFAVHLSPLQRFPHGRQPFCRSKLSILLRDKFSLFRNECLAGRPKIKLIGMTTEVFA